MQKQVLLIGGCSILTEYLTGNFTDKNFEVTLLANEDLDCQLQKKFDISHIPCNFEDLEISTIENNSFDYVLINAESKDFTPGTLQKTTDTILRGVKTTNKIILISQSAVGKHDLTNDKATTMHFIEEKVQTHGSPYLIFKPSLFMELLKFFVRGNQVTLITDQKYPVHWISAQEAAAYISKTIFNQELKNRTIYLYGPEKYNFQDALSVYTSMMEKEVRFDPISIAMFKSFAQFSNNKSMMNVAERFQYYSSFAENGKYLDDENCMLYKASVDLKSWSRETLSR